MLVRFSKIADGPGPSEMVIGIKTADGQQEEVIVSRRQDRGGCVDVGSPLMSEVDRQLIELPRESTVGRWRVWVLQDQLVPSAAIEAA